MAIPAYDRYGVARNRGPAVRWVKEWVPQDLLSSTGKCSFFRWITEDQQRALKEGINDLEQKEVEPEPTTEVLFLCSYEGCGKTFIDVSALRKHAHIHGERQFVCHYDGCGKKFLDSSKLKRHFLIHTGARDFICPVEGCGKAFSLDFNLRAHMKTHSAANYHVCPLEECGKRFTHECKLNSHMKMHHVKNVTETVKHTPPADKPHSTAKTPEPVFAVATAERPFACPYEGCDKAYIHEYKLNLHLRRTHPGHNSEENGKHAAAADHDVEAASDHDTLHHAKGGTGKSSKRKPAAPVQKLAPPPKAAKKSSSATPASVASAKKQWVMPAYEDDSEETEEDCDNGEEDGWRCRDMDGDDEETEDEE